ncbi:MAG: 1-aminocyclopropane-1-carboxylate deaminase/D-cysteine desulfhydrase [Bacteroidota bacterium]
MNSEFFSTNYTSENQFLYTHKGVSVYLKREDLIHPFVSGNKFRKLKYNIDFALQNNYEGILSFGGAFSNHIMAVAEAGKMSALKTLGVIRGEELAVDLEKTLAGNDTLNRAAKAGMQFKFINRNDYRNKAKTSFLNELKSEYPDYFIIPEGGTNDLAIKGTAEILQTDDQIAFDYIATAVGTGGTLSGIVNATSNQQKVLGFSALKGMDFNPIISKFTHKKNWSITDAFSFGGYAKITSELVRFINQFYQKHQVYLDPIYTGKMLYGIESLIENDFFTEKTKVLAIHTGGLQGIKGVNQRLAKKQLPTIIEPNFINQYA